MVCICTLTTGRWQVYFMPAKIAADRLTASIACFHAKIWQVEEAGHRHYLPCRHDLPCQKHNIAVEPDKYTGLKSR
jgi:hypothetical protein